MRRLVSDKGRVYGAAGGALGLGTFGLALGACCSVPWAVALFGVTGAIAFVRLSFLLPYALIGSVLLLGLGFWWVYRMPDACADGTCEATNRHGLKVFIWIAALIVLASWLVLISTGFLSVALA
jgi:hypothetical protein